MNDVDNQKRQPTFRDRGMLGLVIGFVCAALVLHLLYLTSAGGLWRDEAGGVGLATKPGFSGTLEYLTRDSFPILFPMVIKVWSVIGLGGSDFGLRCLGFLIGGGLFGMFWWVARVFGSRIPLLALGLFALSPTLIRWGDSLRAYGLGCILLLWFIGGVWSLVVRWNWLRASFTCLAGILAVNCLYQNAFLIGATCISAFVVCVRRKIQGVGWRALLLGFPAALSLLPYLKPLKESQNWWIVEKTGFKPQIIWHTLVQALDSPMIVGTLLWIIVLVATGASAFFALERRVSRREDIAADLPLFGGVAVTLGVAGFFTFVVTSGLPTQPWYWLPLMTFVICCGEASFGRWLLKSRRWSFPAVGALALVTVLSGWNDVRSRMTNMDRVAVHLNQHAAEDDLVIVYPWYYGVSFNRYYRGKAPWMTLPEIGDFTLHRYDLLKVKLQEKEPVRASMDKIGMALRTGKRVWLVGVFPRPLEGEVRAPTLPPAPEGPEGWYDEPYNYSWGRQADEYISRVAVKVETVLIPEGRFTRYESVPLFVASSGDR